MKLISVELSGFKSISGALAQTIPLGDVTVLLGANGSGKSNLVQFFKLLNFLTTGALQTYVGKLWREPIAALWTERHRIDLLLAVF